MLLILGKVSFHLWRRTPSGIVTSAKPWLKSLSILKRFSAINMPQAAGNKKLQFKRPFIFFFLLHPLFYQASESFTSPLMSLISHHLLSMHHLFVFFCPSLFSEIGTMSWTLRRAWGTTSATRHWSSILCCMSCCENIGGNIQWKDQVNKPSCDFHILLFLDVIHYSPS